MIPRFTDFALALGALMLLGGPATARPLLTGVVEDSSAQTIEMPSLPGAWQRRIEWMAQEGAEVDAGDVVVRLDPGDLIAQEEQARTDLEKKRLAADRRINELKLQVMDSEQAVAEARSRLKIAELDAGIPAAQIPRLDYERYQLEFQTAREDLIRREAELLNRREELADVGDETALEIQQADSHWRRIQAALDSTEIAAEKSGFIIYAENPWTGQKVFPGETLFSGFQIASIASREDLQVRFWVHEADILKLQPDTPVEVRADALRESMFPARITWVSNQAVEKQDWGSSGYFEVLAAPEGSIPTAVMPGMSVMGKVVGGGSP
ncbi:MAG: hypothetical protein R3200_13860 [Xanthomonadales bacterium]|nr:hypothetical protein [Xanthomonadales bacterium]